MRRAVEFEGWRTPADFISDGCTLSPDRWFCFHKMKWVDLTDACILHDFHRLYRIVTPKESDKIFRRHLIHVGAPRYIAYFYWFMLKKTRKYFTRTEELPICWEKYAKKVECDE